jgi:hypothetical protein
VSVAQPKKSKIRPPSLLLLSVSTAWLPPSRSVQRRQVVANAKVGTIWVDGQLWRHAAVRDPAIQVERIDGEVAEDVLAEANAGAVA